MSRKPNFEVDRATYNKAMEISREYNFHVVFDTRMEMWCARYYEPRLCDDIQSWAHCPLVAVDDLVEQYIEDRAMEDW